MHRLRDVTWRSTLAGLSWAGLVIIGVQTIDAQERIRLMGWVQWVAGMTMQVMTTGGTVAVDLREAEQGSYRGLRTGDRVVVEGVVSGDRRRVVAYGIWRGGDGVEAP
jgi:hypothetical protein